MDRPNDLSKATQAIARLSPPSCVRHSSIDAAASLSFSAGAQVPGGNPTETNSTLGVQECQAGWGSGVKGVSQQERAGVVSGPVPKPDNGTVFLCFHPWHA